MSAATLYEIRHDSAWITLNEPEKRNALSEVLVDGLRRNLHTALSDQTVRFIVLTGAGSVFCAGADLKSLGGAAVASGGDLASDNPLVHVMKTLWESPKPVIGRINGHAYGGGLGLVAACDLTLATDSAQFSFSEVRVGVIPAMISVLCLRKLGIQNAMWLFLTGERINAGRAVELGLIHRALAVADLDPAIEATLKMLRLGGPIAVGAAKQLVRKIPELTIEDGYTYATGKIAELFASEEAAEGMAAFMEKRPPRWTR